MLAKLSLYYLFYLCTLLSHGEAFIPHPIIAEGSQSSDSITHAEITELGFIRAFARFVYDTRLVVANKTGANINLDDFFVTQHTVDSLCKLAHPEYSSEQLVFYSLPLKFTLDLVMTTNALVDFDSDTKKLSAAHFDSEAFNNGSRRIINLRKQVVTDVLNGQKDLTDARQKLGQLLHTLQDFYSHSNWVEMGKTDINDLIGRTESIGSVAGPTQATCSDSGCTKKILECSLWQKITLRNCPLVYYDCANNILPAISSQQLLTSGYLFNQLTENNQPLNKPANVGKCSHGSVIDDSANVPAIGGINKDSNNLLFSPHSNLHFQAVEFAVNATERFLNDLRKEIGDDSFDRLFMIHPSEAQAQNASSATANGRRFRFFTARLSASLKKSDSFFTDLKNTLSTIKSVFTSLFSKNKSDVPTYTLSDRGVNTQDTDNVHAAPYIFGRTSTGRKKRWIDARRTRL